MRNDSIIVFSTKAGERAPEQGFNRAALNLARRIGRLEFGKAKVVTEIGISGPQAFRIGTRVQHEYYLYPLASMPGSLNALPSDRQYYRLEIRFPKRKQFTKLRAQLRDRLGARLGRYVQQRPSTSV